MTASSQIQRSRGTSLEQLVSKVILNRGIRVDPKCNYTKRRMCNNKKESISDNFDIDHQENPIASLIESMLDTVLPPVSKRQSFQLKQDSAGHLENSSSDIIVRCCPNDIHFSVKHNNLSIKHPKANRLNLQMKMKKADADRYTSAYAKINSRYYKQWTTKRTPSGKSGTHVATATTFASLPGGEKNQLYREINELTVKYILKASDESLDAYIKFLLDLPSENKYIIKCDFDKNIVSLLQLKTPTLSSSGKAKAEKPKVHVSSSGTTINLEYKGYLVSLRLHNCTTRIMPTLGLKYDVKVHNGFNVVY